MEFKTGSTLHFEITKAPTHDRDVKTMQRLMRLAPGAQNRLARLSRERGQNADERTRAGRIWVNRPKVGKVFHPNKGETWELQYRPQLRDDIASVSEFVKIKAN